jgi:hypothetical protein
VAFIGSQEAGKRNFATQKKFVMNNNMSDISFLYNEDPDLDKAWEDLRQKLDEKFPVKKYSRAKRFIAFLFKTSSIFLILMTCYLLTNDYYDPHQSGSIIYINDDRDIAEPANKIRKLLSRNDALILREKNLVNDIFGSNATTSFFNVRNKKGDPHAIVRLLGNPKNGSKKGRNTEQADMKRKYAGTIGLDTSSIAMLNTIDPEKVFPSYKINESSEDTALLNPSPAKRNKEMKKGVIGFDIGAYYNIGNPLPSGIYPIANVNVLITKKSTISLGIGLSSNVSVRNFSPKEFIILNDTANLAQFSVTRNEVKKFTYIDLPVSFKYKISERWAAYAGAQISFLQNFSREPDHKIYDFQTELSKVIAPQFVSGPTGVGLRPLLTYAEKYTIKKTNWRFIAGINYQIKDAGLKLQYQRSFTSNYDLFDFGGINSRKKLSLFTVGVYYRIR